MKDNFFTRHFHMWKVLKIGAITTIALVSFQVFAAAYNLTQEIVTVDDNNLKISWDIPEGGSDHFRIEVLQTDLFAEPVNTELFFEYSKNNIFEMELFDGHSYNFRVQGVSAFGEISDFSETTPLYIYDVNNNLGLGQADANVPKKFSLSQNYPNPFNMNTRIEYTIPENKNERVHLAVYSILGQLVKELVSETKVAGNYVEVWDGRNNSGNLVASGNYVYRLIAGNYKMSKKMILLK